MVVRPFIDTFRPSPLNGTAYPNRDPEDDPIPVGRRPDAPAPALPPRPMKTSQTGAAPSAPSDVSSRSATAFARMANVLHRATRNRINEGDAAGVLFFGFGLGDSMKRLEGKVTPAEADALIAAAKALPEEQRHILSAAIKRNISSRDLVAVASTEIMPEEGEQRPASAATAALTAFVTANPATSDEKTIGEILGMADVLLNRAHRVLVSAKNGQPVSDSNAKALDSARVALENALEPAQGPSSLRTAVIAFVRKTIAENHGGFPANFASLPVLAKLHALLYP